MAAKPTYERKVAEVFGYPAEADSPNAQRARKEYECPFLGTRCVKPSQHRDYDPSIPFGACSVWHRGVDLDEPQPFVICPVRFIQDQIIFLDSSRLFQPRKDTKIIVIPELGLPIGRIDYILAQYHSKNQEVLDFIVLEVMACSTTSTGDVLRSFHDALQGRVTYKRLKYGINYRQILSRMMVQVLAKAYACEKWNIRMIWAVQDVLYGYMRTTTKVELHDLPISSLGDPPSDMPILFFVYGMELNQAQQKYELKLKEIHGCTKENFARILEPQEIPDTSRMLELLHRSIQNKASVFSLNEPLPPSLAIEASRMVQESIDPDK